MSKGRKSRPLKIKHSNTAGENGSVFHVLTVAVMGHRVWGKPEARKGSGVQSSRKEQAVPGAAQDGKRASNNNPVRFTGKPQEIEQNDHYASIGFLLVCFDNHLYSMLFNPLVLLKFLIFQYKITLLLSPHCLFRRLFQVVDVHSFTKFIAFLNATRIYTGNIRNFS